jgi:hypothetical protein
MLDLLAMHKNILGLGYQFMNYSIHVLTMQLQVILKGKIIKNMHCSDVFSLFMFFINWHFSVTNFK